MLQEGGTYFEAGGGRVWRPEQGVAVLHSGKVPSWFRVLMLHGLRFELRHALDRAKSKLTSFAFERSHLSCRALNPYPRCTPRCRGRLCCTAERCPRLNPKHFLQIE